MPHHTTQHEFTSKLDSPTSLTVNTVWNLEMRRMSMTSNYKTFHQTGDKGAISSHLESRDTRPSPHQRRWNCGPGRCVSRKRSSSKLQPVPGQRKSDMEVDQGWRLWDLVKYKWDTTISFRLWVSTEKSGLIQGKYRLHMDAFPAKIMPRSK